MKLLELFSGAGSISKPWREAGHEVVSVDIDSRFHPEICEDILQWSYVKLEFIPDVIWASPPCTEYSRAKTTGPPRNLTLADQLVAKALKIIKYFRKLNPELIWFLENGDSTLLWKRDVAKELTDYVRLDYCQYGTLYRKRTRIAHSPGLIWTPRLLCDPKTCHACENGVHKASAQQGPGKKQGVRVKSNLDSFSRDQLHALPSELCQEIFNVCQANMWELINGP